MSSIRRLGARALARTRGARDGDQVEVGAEAVFAHILDGEHLWLAVPADSGQPGLREPATGRIVQPDDHLPVEHRDLNAGCLSVRWPLDGALPVDDGAELDVVTLADGDRGGPRPVTIAALPSNRPIRIPTTDDGAWQFELVRKPDSSLQVRRTLAPRVARLLEISSVEDGSVAITVEDLGRDSAELLLLDEEETPAARLPMHRTTDGFTRTVADADIPAEPASYRVELGSPDDRVPVARAHNDVFVADPAAVPLPLVLAEGGDQEAARVRFGPGGRLRIVRVNELAEEDDA